jgi:hypothetical protein
MYNLKDRGRDKWSDIQTYIRTERHFDILTDGLKIDGQQQYIQYINVQQH